MCKAYALIREFCTTKKMAAESHKKQFSVALKSKKLTSALIGQSKAPDTAISYTKGFNHSFSINAL